MSNSSRARARLRIAAVLAVVVVLIAACTNAVQSSPTPGSSTSSSEVALGNATPAPGSTDVLSGEPGSSGAQPSELSTAAPSVAVASIAHPTARPTAGPTPQATPGPAVRFEVTGLVDQPQVCFSDCGNWPPADFPRQLVLVRALDAQGRVATGYNGTVTFKNPAFPPGDGGVPDSKLKKGIGLFAVLVPSLSLWDGNQPWASLCPDVPGGGTAFYVRDTVNPNLMGCESTEGGSYTIVLPKLFDSVSLPDCQTGCFDEPTGTIVIDQNLLAPKVYTATDDSMTIRGETHQDQFYSESVSVSYFYYQAGDAVGLDACIGCAPTTPILMQRPDVHLDVRSTLDYGGPSLGPTPPPATIAELNDLDVSSGTCLYSGTELGNVYCILTGHAQAVLNNGFGPTCYDNNTYDGAVFCLGG